MDQVIAAAFIFGATGLLLGVQIGASMANAAVKRRNKEIARQMVESVKATKTRRKPENMMDYGARQRTADNWDNPNRARQGQVRFRTKPLRRRD